MDAELLGKIKLAAYKVFEETPVFLAYAHGSRVHGSPSVASDLDIGYYLAGASGRSKLPLRDELALEAELTRAVGCEIDLRDLGPAPLEARGKVLEQGVRVYCSDEPARVELETALLARYHDYKPAFAAMHAARLAACAKEGSGDGQ